MYVEEQIQTVLTTKWTSAHVGERHRRPWHAGRHGFDPSTPGVDVENLLRELGRCGSAFGWITLCWL